jgi:hypothetical protein
MNIDVSGIIADKLAQMEADGTIKKKIEEAIEKSVLGAVTSELEGYSFRRSIEEELRKSTSGVAANCGLSGYNGFIAEKVRQLVQNMYTEDFAQKVQAALSDTLLQKHEGVKLSDIFKRYQDWVCEHTDYEDQYDRQTFTADLDIDEDGVFTRYRIRFADEPLKDKGDHRPDITIGFYVYGDKEKDTISSLWLNDKNVRETVALGHLSEFEAFLVNLFYNNTEILLDQFDADAYSYFDIDI